MNDNEADERVAFALGITVEELAELDWDITDNSSDDGLLYSYIVTVQPDGPPHIVDKIDGLDPATLSVHIDANVFDEPDGPEEE
ncbi:hypothetical protein [Mesorhizobium sp. M2C.T.Ca.TU.002.02.1.1]|uniref:hypothetical protein n=1 Tax=Mesorhizobium sp. M2C.T.Ca.TU.002.02.1.1 TaxID=2496788 RepID=UPI000FCBF4BD|nr:hypothetical protein [Mesorhizobium sp. M2C.T.Ca.TU.002.02.1.1]RUU58236.1 hypothetical protein EOD07_10555 [Mesorhizobium sp. M2C.T.Ca.TU.002.02.1.1]RUU71613.1 hypothetical protein EOD04_02125 [Mesorhizobium sp. M2C.T.Ca.TU.009.01.2.1]